MEEREGRRERVGEREGGRGRGRVSVNVEIQKIDKQSL